MFTKKCSGCDVVNNQGEQRVADHGASRPIYLLKETNQAMSIEETIRFVEVRAAGKRSVVTITTPTSTSALNDCTDQEDALPSGYRRQHAPAEQSTGHYTSEPHRGQPTETSNQKATCCFCGYPVHGERARTAIRRTQCPAFGSTCTACNRPNHFANLCWRKLAEKESAVLVSRSWTVAVGRPCTHAASRRWRRRTEGEPLRNQTKVGLSWWPVGRSIPSALYLGWNGEI